mmetsp:Transcript_56215/g.89196  ORF Transcript_56215/g.89196 Transcript_56215/m.89196 type:complete len:130 (-) Transcript_56215:98-487(-)
MKLRLLLITALMGTALSARIHKQRPRLKMKRILSDKNHSQAEAEAHSQAETSFHSLVGQIRNAGSGLQLSQGHDFKSEGHVGKEISSSKGNVCCKDVSAGRCFCTETENSCIVPCPADFTCPSTCSRPR